MNATVLSPRLCSGSVAILFDGRLEKGSLDSFATATSSGELSSPLPPSLSLRLFPSFFLCVYTNTYLSGNCIVYSSWQASRPFFPVTYPAQGIGPPAWYYKGSHDPIVSITFHRDIYAYVVAAVPYVHALVDSPTTYVSECVRACLSIKSACRLIL